MLDLDKKVMNTLIGLYNEIDEQIKSLGYEDVQKHAPDLFERQTLIKEYVANYAQHYCEGLAYADHMSVSQINEGLSKSTK